MSERGHSIASAIMAGIGLVILVACAVVEVAGVITGKGWEIPHTVFYVGLVVGFVGFYGRDPKRAKDGGEFVVTSAVRILGALPRFGRRASDAVAIPGVETKVTAVPTQKLPRDDADGIEPTP